MIKNAKAFKTESYNDQTMKSSELSWPNMIKIGIIFTQKKKVFFLLIQNILHFLLTQNKFQSS